MPVSKTPSRKPRSSKHRSLEGQQMTRWSDDLQSASLVELMDYARTAMPRNVRIAAQGTDQEHYQSVPGLSSLAGVNGSLSLRQMLPQLTGKAPQTYNIPAGSKVALSAALAERSRVAQAGTRIIPVTLPEPPSNAPAGAFYERAGAFTLLEPADFQAADDETPAVTQALPFKSEDIDVALMRSYAVRFSISRREQRDIGDAEMSARIMTGVAMGLANLVDRELLADLEAALLADAGGTAMPAFSLASAASTGLRFEELRALVGTNATGAVVGQDGALRVAGVPAELTAEAPNTFVGAFDRSAVAIIDDLPLLVQRGGGDDAGTSSKGRITVTAWVDLLPLVPSTDYFWSAA